MLRAARIAHAIVATCRSLAAYLRRHYSTLLLLLCASTLTNAINNSVEPFSYEAFLRLVTGYGSVEEVFRIAKLHEENATRPSNSTEISGHSGPGSVQMVAVVLLTVCLAISAMALSVIFMAVMVAPFEVATYAALGTPGRLTWRDTASIVRQTLMPYIRCRISYTFRSCLFFWFGFKALRDWWLAPLIVVHEPHLCSDARALILPGGTSSPVFVRSRQLIARNPLLANCTLIGMIPVLIAVRFLYEFAFDLCLPTTNTTELALIQGVHGPELHPSLCRRAKEAVHAGTATTLLVVANAYLFERLLRSV